MWCQPVIVRIYVFYPSLTHDNHLYYFISDLSITYKCCSSFSVNTTVECSKDSFTCASGLCINNSRVCDKTNDCSDWSDEKACGM